MLPRTLSPDLFVVFPFHPRKHEIIHPNESSANDRSYAGDGYRAFARARKLMTLLTVHTGQRRDDASEGVQESRPVVSVSSYSMSPFDGGHATHMKMLLTVQI
jgi:hypothetical protein